MNVRANGKFLAVVIATAMAIPSSSVLAGTITEMVDFETPPLGDLDYLVLDPYIHPATGVTFYASSSGGHYGQVGLVKNSATSACVDPPDDNQKLGTGPRGGETIGLSGHPFWVVFPGGLYPPVTVSVEVQVGVGVEATLELWSPTMVITETVVAGPAGGTCGNPGQPRARFTIVAESDRQVFEAYVYINGDLVFVIDDFTFTHSGNPVSVEPPGWASSSWTRVKERYRSPAR